MYIFIYMYICIHIHMFSLMYRIINKLIHIKKNLLRMDVLLDSFMLRYDNARSASLVYYIIVSK